MASRVIAMQIKGKAADKFAPLQYGIGISGGSEIIIHAISEYLSANEEDLPDRVALGLDCKNAFNSIHRSVIFERLMIEFPELFNFFIWKYGSLLYLFFPVAKSSEVAPKVSCKETPLLPSSSPSAPFLYSKRLPSHMQTKLSHLP